MAGRYHDRAVRDSTVSDVLTFLGAISISAKQAESDLVALASAEKAANAAKATGGGSNTGEMTGGKGGGSGSGLLGSSVTAAGSGIDAGMIIGALRSLGGR